MSGARIAERDAWRDSAACFGEVKYFLVLAIRVVLSNELAFE